MKANTGKRIKKWREQRGLSQLDAAKGAHLSQSEWQKLESGRSQRISLQTARRLVAYTGGVIGIDDLCDPRKLPAPAAESGTSVESATSKVA